MAITYENIAYDRVLKGVETILEAEFTNEAVVYLSPDYQDNTRKSIRLWNLPTEPVIRLAGAVTDIYPVQISCYVPIGQRSTRVVNDEVAELSARVKRLMDNNCAYSPSGVYKWHSTESAIDPTPDRVEEVEGVKGEPSPSTVSMNRVLTEIEITEAI